MNIDATRSYARTSSLLLLLATTGSLQAQSGSPVVRLTLLPPGLTLPVHLSHSIYAGRTPPSSPIVASTTQRIPISKDRYLKAGTEITGLVVDSGGGKTPTLTLQFTSSRAASPFHSRPTHSPSQASSP